MSTNRMLQFRLEKQEELLDEYEKNNRKYANSYFKRVKQDKKRRTTKL